MERLIQLILLGDGERKSVTKLLKGICDKFNVDGCVLWRATTESTLEQGSYTMLASWFEGITDSYPSVRSLSYSNKNARAHASAEAGRAWLNNDFVKERQRFAQDRFFLVHGIKHAMVMRFNYARSGRYGVVVLYRKTTEFGDSDLNELQPLKDILPHLYRAARDQMGFKLITRVSKNLRIMTEQHDAARKDKKTRAEEDLQKQDELIQKETIRRVGEAIRDCFDGLETSVFLDVENAPGIYRCAWTDPRITPIVDVAAQEYRASLKQPNGFSGFVIHTGESVHVYDTQRPELDEAECRKIARDFEGHSCYAKNAADAANRHLQVNQQHNLPPPHSLVIVPITGGGRTLGFLRCWIALTNPQYYSQDDEDLLRLVALDLGRVIGDWRLARQRRAREQQVERFTAEAWKGGNYDLNPAPIVRDTDSLTKDVLRAILELVDALVPGSEINSVRLLDKKNQAFYFYLYPHRGTLVAGKTPEDLQAMSFPLPGRNLASKLFRNPPYEPMLFGHLDKVKTAGYTNLYEGVRHMIVAPIIVNGEIEGVLDIRSKSDELLEPEALGWTKIIVFMMSLLISSQRQQAAARDAAIKAATADKDLRNAFEDLAHQMKSPLLEAQNQISSWFQRNPFQVDKADAHIMRSLIDRAQHTTQLINVFAAFASGKTPKVARTMISPVVVAQVIDEICCNARPRIHAHRNIRISYDTEQAIKHAPAELKIERRLLAEALNNLVDNASKYSYSSTTISITCGRTGTGRFCIGVRNRGIRVKPQDVRHMTERGWRGGEAELVVGEGSGLGLYIVDMIMKLHGGWLDISPTSDTTGATDVRLIFPNDQPP